MAKVILLSQYPLPYGQIGSWTKMYRSYLESEGHRIDYIICKRPETLFPNVEYAIIEENWRTKIRRRTGGYFKVVYLDALKKIISQNPDEKFIIQTVDSYDVVPRINAWLKESGMRDRCYIQIFYHGFVPFIGANKYPDFYENIDELILLTHDSYKFHKEFYSSFPCRVSVLHNGIDTSIFHSVSQEKKDALKLEQGLAGKKVLLWCSVDRPKKGLGIMLQVWKKISHDYPGTVLMVVGAKRDNPPQGVIYMGRLPNETLPQFFQMADCYLFPSLCHEGFPLALTEALNCGCHCMASDYGGIPEVLDYGHYGTIIKDPNFVSQWENALRDYLSGKLSPIHNMQPMYTLTDWIANMNAIIDAAKSVIS